MAGADTKTMALEELNLTDSISIKADGSLNIRYRNSIVDSETGVERAKTFSRHIYRPGEDVSGECDRVQAVAAAVWTTQCVDAYAAAHPATESASDVTETPTE